MRYDWLFEPISEAEPCGPDLDDIGDEKYLNYVLSVTGRIPDQYYDVRTNKPVDRTAIKVKDEVEAIGALLKETRDVRLLGIEARFHCFVGDMAAFADCLEATAGLLQHFWPDVHPKAIDGDFTIRQNVVGGLDDWKQIIQPLHYATLVRDRRLGPILFRYVAIANGSAAKREDEVAPALGDVQHALASEENRASAELSFDAATRALTALGKIRETFIENSGYEYAPSFDRLTAFLTQLLDLFRAARPEFGAAQAAALEEAEAAASNGAD